jgi:ribosome-associated toxin RatA of RatAB toxin-antitoxin module
VTTVTRTALLPYSAEEIFGLVSDVARYREFLPFCIASEVLEQDAATQQARIAFSRLGMSQSLTTRNSLQAHSRIDIEFVSGPFEHLRGCWEFQPLQAVACKVHFTVDFQVQTKFMQFAAATAINQAATQTVDAFQRRAVQVYGKR